MITVWKHNAGNSKFAAYQYVKGSLITPSGAKKLVGALVTASTVMHNDFDVSHAGFNLKIQINNKEVNPVNNHFDGGRAKHPFKNLSEKRLLPLDCELKKSQKINYTLIANSDTIHSRDGEGNIPDLELKVYLIFE